MDNPFEHAYSITDEHGELFALEKPSGAPWRVFMDAGGEMVGFDITIEDMKKLRDFLNELDLDR